MVGMVKSYKYLYGFLYESLLFLISFLNLVFMDTLYYYYYYYLYYYYLTSIQFNVLFSSLMLRHYDFVLFSVIKLI